MGCQCCWRHHHHRSCLALQAVVHWQDAERVFAAEQLAADAVWLLAEFVAEQVQYA